MHKHAISKRPLFDGFAPASISRSHSDIGSYWTTRWQSPKVERRQWSATFQYLLEVRFGFSHVMIQCQAQLDSSGCSLSSRCAGTLSRLCHQTSINPIFSPTPARFTQISADRRINWWRNWWVRFYVSMPVESVDSFSSTVYSVNIGDCTAKNFERLNQMIRWQLCIDFCRPHWSCPSPLTLPHPSTDFSRDSTQYSYLLWSFWEGVPILESTRFDFSMAYTNWLDVFFISSQSLGLVVLVVILLL